MRIYLLKDLKGHGKAGEIVNLNDGYAKNFVIKNNIGKIVNAQIEAEIKSKQQSDSFKLEQEVAQIKTITEKLKSITVQISAKIGANGKLFGSITATELAHELTSKGVNIDKRSIVLPEPIKAAGAYKINVKFAHNLCGEFTLIVEGLYE
jgi:large subunit ribosomal protein L9